MKSLRPQIILLLFLRFLISINMRMVYPFLPVFARGMDVSVAQLALAVSGRSFIGSLSFLLAPIADRFGRKTGILVALALPIAGNSLILLRPGILSFLVGMGLAYMGSVLLVSSIQAYLGDKIPYQQRAQAVGTIELGWAFAFIFGMPAIGLMIQRFNWLTPFVVLVGLSLVAILAVKKYLPDEAPGAHSRRTISLLTNFRDVIRTPAARAGLLMSFIFVMSQEIINLVFGVWLEDSFGLKIAALGAASAILGLADMGGEMLTATIVDRLGKKRSIRVGMLIYGAVVLLLPWLGSQMWGAFAGLFLMYLTYEFVVVSSLPVMAEILPGARATLMGFTVATYAFARSVGALIAPLLYAQGIQANTMAAFVLAVGAIILLNWVNIKPVGHWQPSGTSLESSQ